MADFAAVPFTVLPDTLADNAVDYMRAAYPGWEPASGSVEVHVFAGVARIVSELMAQAAALPPEAFYQYGLQVVQLPPFGGVAATVPVTWTASDSLGHTIPVGTQVAYRVSGDDLIVFEVDADYLIPAGSTALSPVGLRATDVGVAWNAVPSGPLELVDALAWTSTVVANSAATGGLDAETSAAYLNRLAARQRLLTPRPILPDDFSVLAQDIVGVYRALTVDGYDPGVNEVQQIADTGSPTGGTFTLTYSGQTTSAIAEAATHAAVQSALEALSNIAVGDVNCTGGPLPGTPILVEFTGTLGSTNVAQMTHTDSLTGGVSPAVVITTVTGGVAPSAGNERMVTVFPQDSVGADCSTGIRSSVQTYLDGKREVSFIVHTGTATRTTINVTYAVHVLAGFDSTTVVAAATAALTSYLSPAVWAGGLDSPPVWRSGENKVRYLAVSAVLAAVPGVDFVSSLTVNSGTSDVTLTGTAPLPAVGTISGSAV